MNQRDKNTSFTYSLKYFTLGHQVQKGYFFKEETSKEDFWRCSVFQFLEYMKQAISSINTNDMYIDDIFIYRI